MVLSWLYRAWRTPCDGMEHELEEMRKDLEGYNHVLVSAGTNDMDNSFRAGLTSEECTIPITEGLQRSNLLASYSRPLHPQWSCSHHPG